MSQENGPWWTRAPGGAFDELSAEQVLVQRSAVRSIDADQARLERAAVQRLRAGHATIERSAMGSLAVDRGTMTQSTAGLVVARSVAVDESRVGVLISPVVRGEVHTWLDMRSAVAMGVGLVLGKALIAGGRALVRRKLAGR